MSIEQAMLARAQPYVLAARARDIVRHEVSKGCQPQIAPQPVALEPVYQPIQCTDDVVNGDRSLPWTFEKPASHNDLARLQIWISPQQKCDWVRSELLLKQLYSVTHRVMLQIVGNESQIALQLVCHHRDLLVVRSAFLSEFEQCELQTVDDSVFAGRQTPSGNMLTFMIFIRRRHIRT